MIISRKVRQAWSDMKQRCLNERHPQFKNYGARGVSICAEWLSSVTQFAADLGEPPTPLHSIDRIDNDGDYEPGNCRWATPAEQRVNQRGTRWLMIGGVEKPLRHWALECGISEQTLHHRIVRLKMPPEDAISKPISAPKSWAANRANATRWAAIAAQQQETQG